MSTQIYIAEIFRLFVAFLLLIAAISKLNAFSEFKNNLNESFGLTVAASTRFAPIVVAVELLLSGLLLLNTNASYLGMAASLFVFLAFTGVVSYRYVKEAIVKCSCFGEADRSVSAYDLLRNLIVIACIIFYLFYSGDASALTVGLWFLTAGLAIILTIVAIEFHEIVMLLFRQS